MQAWASWLCLTVLGQEKRDSEHLAVSYWMNHQIAAAWNAWRDHIANKRHWTSVTQRVMSHFMNRTLARTFSTWYFVATEKREQRISSKRALEFRHNLVVSKAFGQWLQVCINMQEARASALTLAAGRFRRDLWSFFCAWHEYAHWAARTSLVLESAVQKLLHRCATVFW